ncbi:MAG: hypothetical protein AB1631_28710 [Acidobacteriota bacterium]
MTQAKRIIGSVICVLLLLINAGILSYSILRLIEFRHGKVEQLVLQVQTDDAIKQITQRGVEDSRARLKEKGWQFESIEATGDDEIIIRVPDTARNADIIAELWNELGPDWEASESSKAITFKLNQARKGYIRNLATDQTREIIENRINALGVTYPLVARHGGEGAHQILIQMPGVDDPERVKNLLNADSNLEMRLVAKGTQVPYDTKEAAEAAAKTQSGGEDIYETLFYRERATDAGSAREGYLVVEKNPVITALDMREVEARRGEYGGSRYEIIFRLTSVAATRFGDATEKHVGDYLAIVLNNEVKSAATIQERITDSGRITGGFTQRQAEDLAFVLRSGPLPCKAIYLREETVSSNRWIQKYGVLTGIFVLTFAALIVTLILINRPRRKSDDAYYPTSRV